MTSVSAIIVAAGEGQRFGSNKQAALLKGKPVLMWALEAFQQNSLVSEIILVLRDRTEADLFRREIPKISRVVKGGQERQDSVISGFRAVDSSDLQIVLVHDGARPLVDKGLIDRVIQAADKFGAAVPAVPVEDTVKRSGGRWVIQTEDRSVLYRTQTPQGFHYEILKRALNWGEEQKLRGTDEAFLVEKMGTPVLLVPGNPRNIKITTPLDMIVAEAILEN